MLRRHPLTPLAHSLRVHAGCTRNGCPHGAALTAATLTVLPSRCCPHSGRTYSNCPYGRNPHGGWSWPHVCVRSALQAQHVPQLLQLLPAVAQQELDGRRALCVAIALKGSTHLRAQLRCVEEAIGLKQSAGGGGKGRRSRVDGGLKQLAGLDAAEGVGGEEAVLAEGSAGGGCIEGGMACVGGRGKRRNEVGMLGAGQQAVSHGPLARQAMNHRTWPHATHCVQPCAAACLSYSNAPTQGIRSACMHSHNAHSYAWHSWSMHSHNAHSYAWHVHAQSWSMHSHNARLYAWHVHTQSWSMHSHNAHSYAWH
eukprot:356453-Chlamydomonas_euryale.AAC.1